jgi:hypothetical protein
LLRDSTKTKQVIGHDLYVFFDVQCTQDLEERDGSLEHVPKLICTKKICSKCETVDDLRVDCELCGKRIHAFWQDPVGKFMEYLRQSRPFSIKVNIISHSSRGYDAVSN